MLKNSIQRAEKIILGYLANSEFAGIFRKKDLYEILESHRDEWKISQSFKTPDFIDYLISNNHLKKVELKFPSRKETRYIDTKISIYQVIGLLKEKSYFSHHTAMYFNDLTEQLPKTIYLNVEQSEKPRSSGTLNQNSIDNAFMNKMRLSNNYTEYEGFKIYMLNGKQTGNLGVIDIKGPNDEDLLTTNIERTLIDIIVRPVYAGGMYEVLNAYRKAEGRVSINKITAYLRKMNYVYPYHQAIGFLLETAGLYDYSSLEPLRQFDMEYDFYLTYDMKETEYSQDWRLYYPKGFK